MIFILDTKKYDIITRRMNWTDAQKHCEGLGGNLATFADLGEQERGLKKTERDKILAGYELWIGLKADQNGTWLWNKGGVAASWTNWWVGQPDGGTEQNCARVYAGKWWDWPCSEESRGGVCELPSDWYVFQSSSNLFCSRLSRLYSSPLYML